MLKSPLFIHGDKVVFIQGDGSLTMLDLDTGAVIKRIRLKHELAAAAFEPVGDNILGIGENNLFLLDGKTGDLLWEHAAWYRLRHGDIFICLEESRRLVAISAETGAKVWEMDVRRYVHCSIAAGRLFCLSGRIYNVPSFFLLCLDLENGEILWKKDALRGDFWAKMAATDDGVFVLSGPVGKDDAKTFFNRILAWTPDGDELPTIAPDESDLNKPYWLGINHGRFIVNGVEHALERLPYRRAEWRKSTPAERERLGLSPDREVPGVKLSGDALLVFDIPEDQYMYWHRYDGQPLNRRILYIDAETTWTGKPGYLNTDPRNYPDDCAASSDKAVIANLLGQVECLDRRTGRSLWIYIYPTHSYNLAGYGVWEGIGGYYNGYYVDHLRRYRDAVAGIGVTGTIVEGVPSPSAFTIITDPNPADYYGKGAEIGKTRAMQLHVFIAIAALACLSQLRFFAFRRKKGAGGDPADAPAPIRKSYSAAVFFAFMAFTALVLFFFYGAYSFFIALSLRVLLAALLLICLVKLAKTLTGPDNAAEKGVAVVMAAFFLALTFLLFFPAIRHNGIAWLFL